MNADVIKQAVSKGHKTLNEVEAKSLVASLGLPVPESRLVRDKEEALSAASLIGYPVVLKVVSRLFLHKSDIGGVITGIRDPREMEEAWMEAYVNVAGDFAMVNLDGFLVEKMVPKGIEVIIGAFRDAQFGPAVMFGIGGVAVEYLKDVSFRLAPVTLDEARSMIKEVRSFPLLNGARGEHGDIEAVAAAIVKISAAFEAMPELKEFEVNPFVVYEKGLVAVDARAALK
ncbi:MAG: acetate--CoA ligase family protein [Deltaproteobacteria bacterium]|nr:acetate--CoA ligase family protein [Deltaproteobacteria bacterium]